MLSTINAAKTVHMEIVMSLYLVYNNKMLLIYHFHQETNIVHLVEIVMYDTFLTSFAVYVKNA